MQKAELASSPYTRSRAQISPFAAWALLAVAFFGYLAFQWPQVYSFIVFGFRDQGSFANLEDFFQRHFRLGVDIGYNYGLLGILLQHIGSLLAGGSGYRLSIGIGCMYLAAMAVFWTMLWRRLGSQPEFLAAAVLLSPWIVMYFPVPAYALMQLFVLFGLLCLSYGEDSTALALGVAAWMAVPSLSIAFTGITCGWIGVRWLTGPRPRKIMSLLRTFLPAAGVGVVLGGLLIAVYGWASLRATLLPLGGAAMYKALNFGIFGVGWNFVHPPGARFGYYLGSGVGWWLFGVFLLTVFALHVAVSSWKERHISALSALVLFCFLLEMIFIRFAFGNGFQTLYYHPIVATGVFAGLSTLSDVLRRATLLVFVALGVLGITSSVRAIARDWKDCQRFADTGFLYAPSAFEAEWRPILEAASKKNVMILSYGNGVRKFFPQVHAPDSWFLVPVTLKVPEKQKLLDQIHNADLVAIELGEKDQFIDEDPDVQAALKSFSIQRGGRWFRALARQPDALPSSLAKGSIVLPPEGSR